MANMAPVRGMRRDEKDSSSAKPLLSSEVANPGAFSIKCRYRLLA